MDSLEIKALLQELKNARAESDKVEKLVEELTQVKSVLAEMQTKSAKPSQGGSKPVTITQTLVESKQYKEMTEKGLERMNPVPLKGLSNYPEFNKKAISGLSDARDQFATLRLTEVMSEPLNTKRVKDLFRAVTAKVAVVEWLREKAGTDGFDNQADAVAEGGTKPESDFDFELVFTPMTVLAHWTPITNQTISDLPMLQDHVERRLLEGLKIKEDEQLLYGTGVGAQITGIFNAGIQQYVQQSTESRADAIRKAITKVQLSHYTPDAIVMHPNDWETIELSKDGEDRYLWVGVQTQRGLDPIMWRLPVIVTTAIDDNQALVGAFNGPAATVYDHDQASLAMTDSHGTYFIENTKVIRIEERLTLCVHHPKAFCSVVFGSAYSN